MGVDKEAVPWLCSLRLRLAFVAFWGFVNLYALRVNMSVAMVCMVNYTALRPVDSNTSSNFAAVDFEEDTCVADVSTNGNNTDFVATSEDGEFEWDKRVQSLVLGSFFWGYLVTQVPGGWLAGKFGGKRIFGWCMFVCAASTLLNPIAARTSYIFLLVLRFIAGMCQGVVWPAMHGIWAYWSPPSERSFLIGFSFAGSQIGNVITFPVAALLCEYGFDGGWASVFYVLGGHGVLWFIAWMFVVSDTPGQHPRISQIEKDYIQESLQGHVSKQVNSQMEIPWHRFFTSAPFWGIIITHTCANWMTYTFLTNMPAYLKEVLKFDITSNGFLSAVPYIGMWAMITATGAIADVLVRKNIMNITRVRKMFVVLGEMVPATIVVILGFVDCTQPVLAITLLTIAVSFIGCLYGAGCMVNHADIAPKYAAILFGISNTTATLPGFMAPYVIGVLTTNQTRQEWQVVFYVAAAINCIGCIMYVLLGSGTLQSWARDDDIDNNVKIGINLNVQEAKIGTSDGREKTFENGSSPTTRI